MTPEDMARLHALAFAPERGWSVRDVRELLRKPAVTFYARPGGFALVQTAADEAELLTLAIDPMLRRQGIASELLTCWLAETPAKTAFLEVAEDNIAARALYARHGFAETGRRRRYYRRKDGPDVDAVLMSFAPGAGDATNSPPEAPKTG